MSQGANFTPDPLSLASPGQGVYCTPRTYSILEHFPIDNIAPEASDVEVKVAHGWFECGASDGGGRP